MKAPTVYFDQNVYDLCADSIPADQLQEILTEKGHRLVLGTLDLLEVASCFRNGKKESVERGKHLARYFEALLPIDMLIDIDSLLRREARQAAGQPARSIHFEGRDKEDFEAEIRNLASGIYREKAREFIDRDWERKIAGKKEIEQFYKQPGRLKKSEVKSVNLSDYIRQNQQEYDKYRKQWVVLELGVRYPAWPKRILKMVAQRIAGRPAKYRSWAAGAKVNFFLNFKAARNGTFSQDFPTDLKHISNAAYMDIFVTRDNKCYNNAREIYPRKTVLKADEYLHDKT